LRQSFKTLRQGKVIKMLETYLVHIDQEVKISKKYIQTTWTTKIISVKIMSRREAKNNHWLNCGRSKSKLSW